MKKYVPLNYYKALLYLIKISHLSIDDFAKKAKISPSLIRHANDSWNPKYSTVERICSVVNISISCFFLIAENESGLTNSITMKYVIKTESLSPKELCLKLSQVRINRNLSESQIAKISGINKTNICNREHCKINNNILCSTLEKYAFSYGLSMSALIEKIYNEKI
ncbi:MAG: XRE family transcriptional regulator [Spirochaetia bacterium]|nr:XRE family transcriptional regulator [Spirochaetia bacterium]